MVKILIIGAGKGGQAVLSRLLRFDWVDIVGVTDIDPNAPGIQQAKEAGLPVFIEDPFAILKGMQVDLVFELTGDPVLRTQLLNLQNRTFDIATGQVTHLLWDVIRELEEQEKRVRQRLGEQKILSEISLMLSRSETPDQVFEAIVTGGMRMTQMPAGSLSIYNKEKQELFLVTAKGFSSDFYKNAVYPVRHGGLTEYILAQHEPVLIPDVVDHPSFNNPVLMREGVRSLIAIPLISEKGPIGILYTDDFKPRTFTSTMSENLWMLGTQAVIAIQKQQAFEQIKNLSVRDPLTGIFNRRYLNEIIITEMDRAFRLRHPLSLLLIDIDYFKGINDQFGHLVGDQVLHDLARLFESVIRPYDTFTRYGGEEFLILMSETNEEEAFSVAQRLRESAESARLLPENTLLTCSFGVSTLSPEEGRLPSPEEFIARADKALYHAKGAGRNRVHVFRLDFDSPLPHPMDPSLH
jgi:diguanylate cyclase (GGDEF)-like protein